MLDHIISYIEKYPLSLFESSCVLLPLLVGLLRWNNLYVFLKIIWINCLMLIILDIPMWYLALHKQNNYLWANIQEILSAFLWILSFLWLKEKIPRWLIWSSLLIVLFISILDFRFMHYASWIRVVNRFLFIVLSFIFFTRLLDDLKVKNILNYPPFWLISGLMIMACGTTLIFVFTEVTISYEDAQDEIYMFFSDINDILKIILMFFISVGFWVSKYSYHE